jgi:PAS domain S-box-containing protein
MSFMPKNLKPTETKEMLRRYEFIVNTSRDWHTLINRNYIYKAANRAFCAAHGKTRSQIVGHSMAQVWGHQIFEEIIKSTIDRCLAGQEVNYQAWFETPGQGLQCHDVNCYPYRGKDDAVTHVVVVTRNITRRKQADDSKRKLEAELQQIRKIEALATLSGGIAHEFNNALMVVAGNLELLQMTSGENEEVQRFARATEESIQRMTNLTQQLLAYARGGDFWLRRIDLSGLIKKMIPEVESAIGTDTQVETSLQTDLPPVKADATQIRKVLDAVIQNAAEALEADGRIRIYTGFLDVDQDFMTEHPGVEPGRYAVISVEDNGPGMDEATRAKIFEPFFSTKFQGRGLGMAAAYGIVKNHRGYIYVESGIHRGTTVRILLPFAELVEKSIPLVESEAPASEKTVLVIDDEEKVLNTIQMLVERLGYRVLGARTGQEALLIAQRYEESIELALLDVKLSDMEGGALYPLIQQARPNMKVLVCSGYSLGRRVREILKSGAHGFIQKPFTLKAIEAKFREVLGD